MLLIQKDHKGFVPTSDQYTKDASLVGLCDLDTETFTCNKKSKSSPEFKSRHK